MGVTFVVYILNVSRIIFYPHFVVVSRTDRIQNGQEILDSLAELKISIMTHYEQWRANTYSVQPQAPASHPPHSIAELAERAKQTLGGDPRPFKAWLRIAENARRDAKSFQEQGDLESAFVEYVKASIIVLEKIPAHPDYRVLLSTTQRVNMGLVSRYALITAVRLVMCMFYMNALMNVFSVASIESRTAPIFLILRTNH
jgi:USP8 dimerisation domain